MRAVRLNSWKCEPVPEDAPGGPKPENGQVVVRVGAAGDVAGRAVITPFTEYDLDA